MLNYTIKAGNQLIIFNYNEVINLFLHTLNIYGLLGNHGQKYALRTDSRVISSIDNVIFENVQQGDHYFSYGNLNIYETGMDYIIDNDLWSKSIDDINIILGVFEANFDKVIKKSWNDFYKEYWNNNIAERSSFFYECINSFDYYSALDKMMLATHNEFTDNFYIFPSEALAESALKYRHNICMGNLVMGDDIGFVHEGLHLLLNEEWAKNEEINDIIKKSGYKVNNYPTWSAKFEQALVIGLDCCIRGLHDKIALQYFNGCNVGDLFDVSYQLIKDYYMNGCVSNIELLMKKIISRTV